MGGDVVEGWGGSDREWRGEGETCKSPFAGSSLLYTCNSDSMFECFVFNSKSSCAFLNCTTKKPMVSNGNHNQVQDEGVAIPASPAAGSLPFPVAPVWPPHWT